jgi:hypothetical protein
LHVKLAQAHNSLAARSDLAIVFGLGPELELYVLDLNRLLHALHIVAHGWQFAILERDALKVEQPGQIFLKQLSRLVEYFFLCFSWLNKHIFFLSHLVHRYFFNFFDAVADVAGLVNGVQPLVLVVGLCELLVAKSVFEHLNYYLFVVMELQKVLVQ